MENFVNFLKEYKELLVSVLCVILTFVGILVKRKPKTLDEFIACVDDVLTGVPSYVWFVERPGDGAAKKSEVIDMCKADLQRKLGREMTSMEFKYFIEHIDEAIEMTLKAPHKKEVSK